jgi:hypothetical protein
VTRKAIGLKSKAKDQAGDDSEDGDGDKQLKRDMTSDFLEDLERMAAALVVSFSSSRSCCCWRCFGVVRRLLLQRGSPA